MIEMDILEDDLRNNLMRSLGRTYPSVQERRELLVQQAHQMRNIELGLTQRFLGEALTHSSALDEVFGLDYHSDLKQPLTGFTPILTAAHTDAKVSYRVNVSDQGRMKNSFILRDKILSNRGLPSNEFVMDSVGGVIRSLDSELYVYNDYMLFNHSKFLEVYLYSLELLITSSEY